MEKTISVIIPTHNCEKIHKAAVNPAEEQPTYVEEIILTDDETVDSSGIICANPAKKLSNIQVILTGLSA